MKLHTLITYITAAFIFSNSAIADDDYDTIASQLEKNFPVSVRVSADVQGKIGKLPVIESKRADDALRVGGQFMQHYLDGYVCGNYPDSYLTLDGLVNTDAISSSCDNVKLPVHMDGTVKYGEVRLLCPGVVLTNVTVSNQGVSLTYQLTQLGTSHEAYSHPFVFSTKNTGRQVHVIVLVDSNNKVYKFVQDDWNAQSIYLVGLLYLEGTYVFHGEAQPPGTSLTKLDVANMEVAKQIRKQAAQVCK